MKIRPFHVWWIGVILFGASLFAWITATVLFLLKDIANLSFNWYYIKNIYLPFFAAFVGFCIPVVCLRVLKRSPARVWICIFVIYVVVMLIWGIIDIRCEHYQVGGHKYPHGPLVDGHKYYFHYYWTWYFLPYRLIEK